MIMWQKISVCVATIIFSLFFTLAGSAHALEATTAFTIPGKYVLLVVKDFSPEEKIEAKVVVKSAKEAAKKFNVEQCQIVFYEKAKAESEGPMAVASSVGDDNDPMFLQATNAEQSGRLKKIIGYEAEPKELYQAYENNEVVADEDFKGKPVILEVKVSGVAKDVAGKPYVLVPVDKSGLFGLRIYLDMKDPFLRELKKGSIAVIQAKAKGFTVKNVMMDGVIASVAKK